MRSASAVSSMSDELIPRAQVGEVERARDHAQLHRRTMIATSVGICAWMIRMDPLIGGAFAASWAGWHALRWRRRARARRELTP